MILIFFILSFKIKLVRIWAFCLGSSLRLHGLWFWNINLNLENSPRLVSFHVIKIGLSLYIYIEHIKLNDPSLGFHLLFWNPSITLTFSFLYPRKFIPTNGVAQATDIDLLELIVFVLFLNLIPPPTLSPLYLVNYNWAFYFVLTGSIVLSHSHTPHHEFWTVTIVGPSQSSVSPSQYLCFF